MNDLIDRQAAIDALSVAQADLHNAYGVGIIRAKKIISELPSAQPEQQWIPCSEQLPIKAGHYLCYFEKPNRIDRIHVDLAYWTGGRWYGYRADAITAWMPLPEPWRGEE